MYIGRAVASPYGSWIGEQLPFFVSSTALELQSPQ